MILLLFLVFCYIGVSLSFISTFLVLFVLVKVKYKDITTYLRIYSTIIDILNTVWVVLWIAEETSLEFCVTNFIYFYSVTSHGFWVFYMSLVMYQIICLKKKITRKTVFKVFLLVSLISIFVDIPFFVYLKFDTCSETFLTDFSYYYYDIVIVLLEFLIVLLIGYFYYNIRELIIHRFEDTKEINNQLFQRVYGYVLLVILFLVMNSFDTLTFSFFDIGNLLYYPRLLIYSYYSFFDSMLYGMTENFKRAISYLIAKNPNFKKQEEYLNELRKEKIIFERYIYDLTGIGEPLELGDS